MIETNGGDFKLYRVHVSDWADILEIECGESAAALGKAIDALMDTLIKLNEENDQITVR